LKVLFLHNHPLFPGPILRSIAALREHNIELRTEKAAWMQDVRIHREWDYDVLLLQEPPIDERFVTCGRPVILMERVDGAQLRMCRRYLCRVAGVIKGYVFKDRWQYNRVNDRAHIALLHKAGVKCEAPLYRAPLPRPQLSMPQLQTLHVGYGFGALDHLEPCVKANVDFDTARPIDVCYAGTVEYLDPDGKTTEVDTHRKLALKAVDEWGRRGRVIASPGRQIPGPEYRQRLLESKVALCPWGWGEATYREYEAMALGTVVIKPATPHVDCWPQIYKPGELYVPCMPDFSDAPDVIEHVLDSWDDYRATRERARKLIVDAWQPAAIAGWMASRIYTIMGGDIE